MFSVLTSGCLCRDSTTVGIWCQLITVGLANFCLFLCFKILPAQRESVYAHTGGGQKGRERGGKKLKRTTSSKEPDVGLSPMTLNP